MPPARWKPPTISSMLFHARRVLPRVASDAPRAAARRSAHRPASSLDTGGGSAPGGVLMHEDRQAARVGAGAGSSRRIGPRRDVELDAVDAGVGQPVDLGLDAIGVDVAAESREARIDLALLEHRPGEEDPR